VDNPDSGAVLRCNPDGTGLEVFHTGLRNPQELAFDEYGNLFTGDNNSDGGDASRWVYVAEGGDSGWRVSYQWHDWPVSRGPWNNERLWDVNSTIPAAYIVPPIANPKIAGPAGLTYYPGTGMPKEYAGHFFLVDFRGGAAGGSGVYTLTNKPKGAGFELTEVKPFLTNLLPTDVEFGYTGGLYVSDWVAGWEPNARGRIYHLFDPSVAKEPVVAETRKLMGEGMKDRPNEELAKLLAHADMRVRLAAQFELASRAGDAVAALTRAAQPQGNRLARLHAIWGLGQIGRKSPSVLAAVVPLLEDRDDEVRAQAAKVLGEAGYDDAWLPLARRLADDASPRVLYFATLSLGKLKHDQGVIHVLEMLREKGGTDPYLRHAAVMALTWIGNLDLLRPRFDPSPAVQMSDLLALRRLGRPEVAEFLNAPDPNLVLEAARAINDLPIEPALPKLAALLDRKGTQSDLVTMRALNAHFRLGTPDSVKAVADFARRNDAPDYLRIEAIKMLAEWGKPSVRDHITGLARPLPSRDAKPAQDALAALVPELLKDAPNAVRLAALLSGGAGKDATVLYDLIADPKQPGGLRAAALGALADRKDKRLGEFVAQGLADPDESLRVAAIRLQPKTARDPKPLETFLDAGSAREQQAVYQALTGVRGRPADAMVARGLDRLLAGTLPPEAQLDLLTAAQGRRGEVATKLAAFEAKRPKPESDPLANYRECLAGGDAERGRKIFTERADVSCLRCHSLAGFGGNAGPDLAAVATRGDRAYLLESILTPNAKIAPGWETIMVRTKKGDTIAGVLKAEDAQSIQLDVPDKGLTTIQKKDVDKRKGGLSAMPEDIAKTLSKQDLRDLVEFLAGLTAPATKPQPALP
jgi:quinoprotein glucose dehydrogenase